MSKFSEEIEDLIEYKKLVVKLEEALKQKDSENMELSKMNLDLKRICDEIKAELDNKNEIILKQITEIKNLKKKYEKEINDINIENEKQKQKYEEKILELSLQNSKKDNIILQNEIETKYKLMLKNKETEIENLKNEINDIKANLILKEKELETIKKNLVEELYTEREIHSLQMKDLLGKIHNAEEKDRNNEEKTILEELKSNIKYNDDKNAILYKELENVRKEKNKIEIEFNKKIFELETELKEEKFNNKIILEEREKILETIRNIRKAILEKDLEVREGKMINQKLIEEIDNLQKENEEKDEKQNKVKNELRLLKKNFDTLARRNILTNK